MRGSVLMGTECLNTRSSGWICLTCFGGIHCKDIEKTKTKCFIPYTLHKVRLYNSTTYYKNKKNIYFYPTKATYLIINNKSLNGFRVSVNACDQLPLDQSSILFSLSSFRTIRILAKWLVNHIGPANCNFLFFSASRCIPLLAGYAEGT